MNTRSYHTIKTRSMPGYLRVPKEDLYQRVVKKPGMQLVIVPPKHSKKPTRTRVRGIVKQRRWRMRTAPETTAPEGNLDGALVRQRPRRRASAAAVKPFAKRSGKRRTAECCRQSIVNTVEEEKAVVHKKDIGGSDETTVAMECDKRVKVHDGTMRYSPSTEENPFLRDDVVTSCDDDSTCAS